MDWPGGSWEATAVLAGVILGVYTAILWVAAAFWTYRDIHTRTTEPAIQAAATIFVLLTGFAGLIVYLIIRPKYSLSEQYVRTLEEEALMTEIGARAVCPQCQNAIERDFVVCPHCAMKLREPCVACGKPINHDWVACPFCGVSRPPGMRGHRPAAPEGAARATAGLGGLADELTATIRQRQGQ